MITISDSRHAARTLRRLRAETGLTVEQFAAQLGICRSAMYYRERGENVPPLDALITHAHALGYDLVLVPRAQAAAA